MKGSRYSEKYMTDSPILISCKQLKKDRKTRFKDFKFFRILRNMDLKVAKIDYADYLTMSIRYKLDVELAIYYKRKNISIYCIQT